MLCSGNSTSWQKTKFRCLLAAGEELMNNFALLGSLSIGLMLAPGCTTKSYVRQQVQPLIKKVNELDERTAENTRQINSTDVRLQHGLGTLNSGIETADKNVHDASTRAQQAQESAAGAQNKATSLGETVDKLDTYRVVSQVAVQFAFGAFQLDSESKQKLDQFTAEVSSAKSYVLVVEGRTDETGTDVYNNDLSQLRAEQVVRYLVSKHDVQPFKVHAIGLGKARPVASNDTAGGRRANRRVDVSLMSNVAPATQGNNATQPGSDYEVELAGPPKK